MLTSDRLLDDAKTALGQGHPPVAVRCARQAVLLTPSSASAVTVLGVAQAKMGSEPGARSAYRWSIPASGGREPKAFRNLARVEEIAGRPDIAEAVYRKGISFNPNAISLVEQLVGFYVGQRNLPAAAQYLTTKIDRTRVTERLAELSAVVGLGIEQDQASSRVRDMLQLALAAPNPLIPNVVSALARIAADEGLNDEASLAVYKRALILGPIDGPAIRGLIDTLTNVKQKVRAASWFCQYSVLNPQDENVMRRAGQMAFEVRWPWRCIGRAMILHERYPKNSNFVEILQDMFSQFKRPDELPYAKAWAISLLERDSDNPKFWDAALRMLHSLKFHEESDPYWKRAIEKFPDIAVLHHNRALFLQDRNLSKLSGDPAKRAAILSPTYQRAYNLIAMFLNSARKVDEAIRLADRYLKIDETRPSNWMNYGTFRRGARDLSGAMKAFRTALKHDPSYAEAKYNVAITGMMMGELYEGFRAYEDRWAIPTFPSPIRYFRGKAIWRGPIDNPSPDLLIYMEQGMGDEVMFSWYLPYVIKDARRILLDCDERLVGIMKRTYPEIEVVGRTQEGDPRAHDPSLTYKAPVGHLPQYYVAEVKEIMRKNWELYCKRGERHPPRLKVDPERLDIWRRRLKERFGDKPVIGVSWRSSLRNNIRDGQYVSIPEVARSLGADVGVINLQYSFTEEEHDEFKALGEKHGFDFHTPREIDLKDDLEDIFAILQVCDACVTPLISLAWMSGAVGTPTWVFRSAAEQRTYHMMGAPFLTWAPSIKLFFRRPGTPWDEVVEAIGKTVSHLAETGEARDVADPVSIPMASTW